MPTSPAVLPAGEFSFGESGSCGSPWPFSFQCRREGREAGDSQSLDLWSSLKEYGPSLHFSESRAGLWTRSVLIPDSVPVSPGLVSVA